MNFSQKRQIGDLFRKMIGLCPIFFLVIIQFRTEKDALTSDLAFDDGRLAVIHVLDAFYRADAELNGFRAIFETCCSELAESQHAKLTSQDVSALLRCFQKFKDQDSAAVNKCLAKIADSIHNTIVSGGIQPLRCK